MVTSQPWFPLPKGSYKNMPSFGPAQKLAKKQWINMGNVSWQLINMG